MTCMIISCTASFCASQCIAFEPCLSYHLERYHRRQSQDTEETHVPWRGGLHLLWLYRSLACGTETDSHFSEKGKGNVLG